MAERRVVQDHQPKAVTEPKPVRMAVITDRAGYASCSCNGWRIVHHRDKVRGDRAQAHLDKRHGGVGIWM